MEFRRFAEQDLPRAQKPFLLYSMENPSMANGAASTPATLSQIGIIPQISLIFWQ